MHNNKGPEMISYEIFEEIRKQLGWQKIILSFAFFTTRKAREVEDTDGTGYPKNSDNYSPKNARRPRGDYWEIGQGKKFWAFTDNKEIRKRIENLLRNREVDKSEYEYDSNKTPTRENLFVKHMTETPITLNRKDGTSGSAEAIIHSYYVVKNTSSRAKISTTWRFRNSSVYEVLCDTLVFDGLHILVFEVLGDALASDGPLRAARERRGVACCGRGGEN
ncbi:9102_t:CDS:2 [Ambispora gerdemannii]|uniref:9102_t:CDS:1 n=1 Tax=Ambispora gerdemannii TaxID=144530 RepID=A0A9N9FUH1_9GLOM|nr:9102_t:CDS:2 [Ambispora gerdemannii]